VGAELTTGESVLEDLLEAEELEDRQVDGGVEAQATLVWAESTVELDTVGAVDLGLELVVFPDDAELDNTLWDGDDLQGGLVFGVLLEEGGVLEGRGQLIVSLLELRLDSEVRHVDWKVGIKVVSED
jgi:hypothetical protein